MRLMISAGPIPAKLDSVKYITNRFRGGLALKTARILQVDHGFDDITIVKWRHNPVEVSRFDVVNVDDVTDYYRYLYRYLVESGVTFDAYILAAAVANLMPLEPFEGKFPSHDYKEGDRIDIPFTIAPRIIDRIKVLAPRSTLIGYKLFDGTKEELVRAAKEVLKDSKANIVFANSPQWAKDRKLAVMPDGSVIPMSFDEHVDFMARLMKAKWFRTKVMPLATVPELTSDELKLTETYPRTKDGDQTFGTFAIRKGKGFVTTTRGKRGPYKVCYVEQVDFDNRVVHANEKATLNAPLLAKIFALRPDINVLLHNHKRAPGFNSVPYAIPGTLEEVDLGTNFWAEWDRGKPLSDVGVRTGVSNRIEGINIEDHGFVAGFESVEAALYYAGKYAEKLGGGE